MESNWHFWADVIGVTGCAMLIAAYLLLQTEKITSTSWAYLFMNLAAAGLIMYSLFWSFNLASFIIEIFWIGISIYGILRKYKKSKVRV